MSVTSNNKESNKERVLRGLDVDRIRSFSDGVFAVAITLLVLSIHVPATVKDEADLQQQLLAQWPSYLSFVLSVVIVGVYWVAHHGLFHYIRRSDRALLWINIFFLMCVTFIPFPAALLGLYGYYRVTIVLYGSAAALTGFMLDLLRWYATSGHRLVELELSAHVIRSGMRRNLIGPFIYLLGIIIAFIPLDIGNFHSTQISLALYILVPVLYILPGRIDRYWKEIE